MTRPVKASAPSPATPVRSLDPLTVTARTPDGMTEHEKELLTERETAALLRVDARTLRNWDHAGRGPARFKLSERRVVYQRAEVLAWIAAQRAKKDAA